MVILRNLTGLPLPLVVRQLDLKLPATGTATRGDGQDSHSDEDQGEPSSSKHTLDEDADEMEDEYHDMPSVGFNLQLFPHLHLVNTLFSKLTRLPLNLNVADPARVLHHQYLFQI